MMNIIQAPTHKSNYGGENLGRTLIVMHGTGKRPGVPAENEIAYLQRKGVGVSYHAYITKTGDVYQMVPWKARAWHAGSSAWQEWTDINDWSVGIGLESSNGTNEDYPAAQWNAALELALMLMQKFDILPHGIVTHKMISVPEGRKVDPVNWDNDAFRSDAASAPLKLPLYSEANEALGTVTVVDGRKAYLPDSVSAALCSGK
jgi:N-acetyl-anhydromuramyl-L-alanine amidase AmpD